MPSLTICPDAATIVDRKSGTILNSGVSEPGFRQTKKNVLSVSMYDLAWDNLTRSEALSIQSLFDSVGYNGDFTANFSSAGLPDGNYLFSPGLQITASSANQYQARATIKEVRGI